MDNQTKRALVRDMLAELKANPLKLFSDADLAKVVPLEQRAISIACAAHADEVREAEIAKHLDGTLWSEKYPAVAAYQGKARRARENLQHELDFIELHHPKVAMLRGEADEWERQVNIRRKEMVGLHSRLLDAWNNLTDDEKAWFVTRIPTEDTVDVRELPMLAIPELGMFPGEPLPHQDFQIRDLETVLDQLRDEEGQ